MADKQKLRGMVPNKQPTTLRRGQGVRFSTDPSVQEETEKSSNVEIEKSSNVETEKGTVEKPRVPRRKPGYEIRIDLLNEAKKLAVDEGRFNYEIVEDALEEYLRKKGRL